MEGIIMEVAKRVLIILLTTKALLLFSSSVHATTTLNNIEVDETVQEVFTNSQIKPEQLIDDFTNNKVMEQTDVLRSGRRASFYRGTFMMWSRDNINFNISGGRVTSSSGFQEAGWIFPNIVRTRGIVRTSTAATTHLWRGTKTIGAGSVTPWGDIVIYNHDYTNYYGVHGNGGSTWY